MELWENGIDQTEVQVVLNWDFEEQEMENFYVKKMWFPIVLIVVMKV